MLARRAWASARSLVGTRLALALAGTPILVLALRATLLRDGDAGVEALLRLGSVAFLLSLVVSLSYFEYSPKTARSGFPRFATLLPVSTAFLVGVHLLAAGVFFGAYGYAWLRWVVPLPLDALALGALALALTTFFTWTSVTMWSLGQARLLAMLLLVACIIVLALCLMPLLADPVPGAALSPAGGMALLLAWLGLGIVLGWGAVARARAGGGSRVRGGLSWYRAFPLPEGASALSAQQWYEQRVFGLMMPTQGLLLAAVLLGAQLVPAQAEVRLAATGLVLACMVLVLPVFGFNMGKEHFDGSSRMSAFWATRPLSDDALANAKLRMLGISVLLTAALVFGSMYPAWKLGGALPVVHELFGRFVAVEGLARSAAHASLLVLVPVALCWSVAANLMCLGLRGRQSHEESFKWYREAGFSLVVLGGIAIAQAEDPGLALTRTGWGMLAVFLLLWSWQVARLCREAGTAAVLARLAAPARAGAMPLAYAVGVTALLQIGPTSKSTVGALFCLIFLYAILPFALAPAALASNRHR